jgi:Spy/CpxP family protein refolding chaperone
MFRVRLLFIVAALIGVCALAEGQDKAKEKDQEKEPATKMRGQLPRNWSKLGLTDEQKQKTYRIHNEYRMKIDALQKQIDELRDKERKELDNVLTDEQKRRLREILTNQTPGAKGESK